MLAGHDADVLARVTLRVAVHQQDALAIVGSQNACKVHGGDGLPDAALEVYDADCFHVIFPFSGLLPVSALAHLDAEGMQRVRHRSVRLPDHATDVVD